jgi:1-aminocyclopropane-1-carboxylate deaminase/D-cysteine desulfhydrase-like pyridoxal-dependent ACC family enzyme
MNRQTLKSKLANLHPIQLGYLNSPLDPLPRLSKTLGGPEIWVKRDDLTWLFLTGNGLHLNQEHLALQATPVLR